MTSTHLPPAVVDRSTRERDAASVDALRAELREWLAEHWDPELRLATWWERLGMAGWASPGLPVNAFGRGLTRTDALAFQRDITEFGAVGPPAGLGLLLAAPTIATHGTQAQIDEYVRDIVTGTKAWCQLFSEPGAGSDLAGLTTRACETATSGSSTARRCGRRADSSPTSACSSHEPTPRSPSTRGSPGSPSTCTSAASRSARCAR